MVNHVIHFLPRKSIGALRMVSHSFRSQCDSIPKDLEVHQHELRGPTLASFGPQHLLQSSRVKSISLHAAGPHVCADLLRWCGDRLASLTIHASGSGDCSVLELHGVLASSLLRLDLVKYHRLVDVSALSSLYRLRHLSLSQCSLLWDISAVAACTSLELLDLTGCGVEDITHLSNCVALHKLFLKRCCVRDISALAQCTALQHLDLSDNRSISDVSALAQCTALRHLDLSDNPSISDVSALARCTALQRLWLRGTGVEDLLTPGAWR